ncbi:MAG: ABC transporter substrate-binding protein, partial [Alphaproteobacteria bacterium]
DVLMAMGTESGKLMQDLLDGGDEITKKIARSFLKARRESLAWTRISEQGYTNARLLPFSYPRG